ncbi:hypothetical protein E4U57_003544 [Claviceps arundinis]|uniref:Uncharacterized protein n=1 Tax=Claviceps arundinis TaxID=1623583 RepID=A0A9P7SPY8_9HYPO|nr:hypothetical protein E4U57_003544 [Claviceps arundinis]KAG5965390.1 hypothetical protein E4U56_001814 [Claviceps arundinis]
MGGGRKVPYPKHVWAPTGGWYAQPGNWRGNTAIAAGVIFTIAAMAFKFSCGREEWSRKPDPSAWMLSRRWSKQLVQWDEEDRLKASEEEREKTLH